MARKKTATGLASAERADLEALLAAERERTDARVAALERDLDDIVESSTSVSADDEHDPEGATLAFERAQVAALLAQSRSHLADLDDADSRLRDGTYGICERCGGQIGLERLKARPTARACVSCASAKAR